MEFVLGIVTVVLGTGWLFTYRAYRKKANGEATQSEAEGWKAVQDVYQETIEKMKEYNNDVRTDRDNLFKENIELRQTISSISSEVEDLKRTQARQGRQLEIMRPFMCGDMKCKNRKKVSIKGANEEENQTQKEE